MSTPILAATRLGPPPWPTLDPFLFCVHHLDHYPEGDEAMAPKASLAGRNLGHDFAGKDGWRMYHGRTIPGFPRHPHRGFETITLARQGYIDHSDSLGATARFGHGDVQWMTAGQGVVHSEMFPLVHRDGPNTGELFQLWINLPARKKMVEPAFRMLWADTIPRRTFFDDSGRSTEVVVIAGSLGDATAPAPPPDSYAAEPDAKVAIWTIRLDPGATFTLPPGPADALRTLYAFQGMGGRVGPTEVDHKMVIQVQPDAPIPLVGGPEGSEILMLQGKPIGEPVANHGPFVMNTRAELQQAYQDYRRTGFGGWPWDDDAPVHARDAGRFAIHADGRREEPEV